MTYTIYGLTNCRGCDKAKNLLTQRGLEFVYINLDEQPERFSDLTKLHVRSVPQIFKGDLHIGSFENLQTFLM